ncbi:uncharacterized protein [Blastocystis hominis]|uniref:RSE1/DDB1/CPSF1 C-terminal domain-containing protein n=1 Tax=Blastocystis hominis TaxID=12968 RepID=D8LYK7_BLAHO|nr:uncharacterized protein [Blastocystis hominis]CBK20662.2 unnamed protein product [Blastocystis hominis]|eukprot:XP_012894710.1 uncharacterized protein [Blastocystis hominis]
MSLLVCFYAGAIVTSLFKQTLQQGKELLVYATIYGTIGSLTPIASIETLETVVALESIIIGKGISLVGRNVDDYRSLFLPSTGVADGAICMRFFRYPPAVQKEIADRFGSSVSDIMETLLKINEI